MTALQRRLERLEQQTGAEMEQLIIVHRVVPEDDDHISAVRKQADASGGLVAVGDGCSRLAGIVS